jgi:hypothetical protein
MTTDKRTAWDKLLVISLAIAWPFGASAQQSATCLSPSFEKRLIAAVAKGEVQLKTIPPGKAQEYSRCYAREACAKLGRIEFEMYALSVITSYDDPNAETEYLNRMRRDRKANNSALDKISPNELSVTCKREIGLN